MHFLPAAAQACRAALWICLSLGSLSAHAAPAHLALEGETSAPLARLPRQVQVLKDIPYGGHARQRFDVYLPEDQDLQEAPVIFMVHGGAWRTGDKAMNAVVLNKIARWVPKGFVLVSTNYRLLPDADPLEQAWDVARALSAAQAKAASWGASRDKFILMGHSAGAHLVSLINASPVLATGLGAAPWLGTVALDSASLDVASTMEGPHLRLYDRAFGRDPGFWQAVSPVHQMVKGAPPLLAVCSSRRQSACPQGEAYRRKALSLGARAQVLPQDLSHGDINARLGAATPYTVAVERFMGSLDASVASLLPLVGRAQPRSDVAQAAEESASSRQAEGATPVQRLKARVKALTSANPSK